MVAVLAVADRVDGSGVGNLEQARCRTAMQSECVSAVAYEWNVCNPRRGEGCGLERVTDASEHSHAPSALALLEAPAPKMFGIGVLPDLGTADRTAMSAAVLPTTEYLQSV